jgi:hypothetical protein
MDGWEGVRYFNRIGRPFPSIAEKEKEIDESLIGGVH